MPRVKRGVTARAKHKKVIRQAKGFRGLPSAVVVPAIGQQDTANIHK